MYSGGAVSVVSQRLGDNRSTVTLIGNDGSVLAQGTGGDFYGYYLNSTYTVGPTGLQAPRTWRLTADGGAFLESEMTAWTMATPQMTAMSYGIDLAELGVGVVAGAINYQQMLADARQYRFIADTSDIAAVRDAWVRWQIQGRPYVDDAGQQRHLGLSTVCRNILLSGSNRFQVGIESIVLTDVDLLIMQYADNGQFISREYAYMLLESRAQGQSPSNSYTVTGVPYTGVNGSQQQFTILSPLGSVDDAMMARIQAALGQNYFSLDQARRLRRKDGTSYVEGVDYFNLDWSGNGDTQVTLDGFEKINDPIDSADIQEHIGTGTETKQREVTVTTASGDHKTTENYEVEFQYIESISVTMKAQYLLTLTATLSIPEAGVYINTSKEVVVEIEKSTTVSGGEKYRLDKGWTGKKLLEEKRGLIERQLLNDSSLSDFTSSGHLQGNVLEWSEAYFPQFEISGDVSSQADDGTVGSNGGTGSYGGAGRTSGGGYAGNGGTSGGGYAGNGGTSGGAAPSGSQSATTPSNDYNNQRGRGTIDSPIKPENGENKYTSSETVRQLPIYFHIDGNQDGVNPIWTDTSPGFGARAELTKVGESAGDSNSHNHITDDYHNHGNGLGSVGLPGAPITMEIGGTIWHETKETEGLKENGENILKGVQVRLVEAQSNTVVATTTTDKNGKYRFYGQIGNDYALVNGLKKYYVLFTYNGQKYEQTYYKDELTGTYSNAKEIERDLYNRQFENIYSDPQSYYLKDGENTSIGKAYATNQRIEKDNEDYATFDGNVLTFEGVYNEFLKLCTLEKESEPSESDYNKVWERSKTYEDVLNGSLKQWLEGLGVTKEYESIKRYIKDTFINATTKENDRLYPIYNQFVIKEINTNGAEYRNIKLDKEFVYLYTSKSDQSRNVNYGLWTRPASDLAMQKDVYKTTLVINGKKEAYTYDKKAGQLDNYWDTGNRTWSNLYNIESGSDGRYIREIRKSDYLYNENDAYGNGKTEKNLQAFVTYKIAVKNQGKYDTKINEIVDYYDADTFDFDGELQGNQYIIKQRKYAGNEEEGGHEERMPGQSGDDYVYSYVGLDGNGTKQRDIIARTQGINNSESESIKGKGYNYQALYLQGITGEKGQDKLAPNETAYVYVTYKVKNDTTTERITLDQDLNDKNGALKIGKKGIAEVNSYATYYKENDTIPNDYGKDPVSVKGKAAGVVDTDSNPGSLKPKDLDDNGNIITDSDLSKDRQQDDCDKSPNINMIIDTNEDSNRVRTFNGAVFEDERNKSSEKAVVGDGKEKNETRVNGVTVQLVELIRNVNEDGVFEGTYAGEKVWSNYTYSDNVHGSKTLPRYASGSDKSSVVISGTGLLAVNPDNLTKDNGEYSFKSIPAGDFYIRFIYGDTAETTMIDATKLEKSIDNSYASKAEIERIQNIKDVNGLVSDINGLKGRNAKSYNGQDYKSTTYQAGVEQTGEYGNYYGIGGFTDYDNQNFYMIEGLDVNKNNTDESSHNVYNSPNVEKDKLYYYNINVGEKNSDVSDAKDVYSYREKVNDWSKGPTQNKTLINNRAEVLASFEKPLTYLIKSEEYYTEIEKEKQKENQISALKELMNNTYMVAQTGLISTEIEKTTQGLDVKDGKYGERQKYSINDLNLGLVERPKAGLKLNKEIDNFNFTNSNNGISFDVTNNQSVSNLSFSKHEQHEIKYNSDNIFSDLRKITTATSNKFSYQAQKAPERLQLYIDPELMNPATVRVRYKYSVENVGEVDYTSKTFYYTGAPVQGDKISTTNAEQVIDYVSNSITYDKSKQEYNVEWKTERISESDKKINFSLIGSTYLDESEKKMITDKANIDGLDYVNRYYLPTISTYNTLITTKKLGNDGGLLPTVADAGTSKAQTALTLTQEITSQNEEDNLTFNNLAEIIETSNTLGRRCAYSIPGNQEMADQSLGKDAAEGANTRTKWILPEEIDADSAQTIVIMPPTGEVNYLMWIIIATIAVAVLGLGGLVLKKCLLKKEK